MSKYDQFLELQAKVAGVVKAFFYATHRNGAGDYDRQNDKATFHFQFNGLLNDSWTPAKIYVEMAHGYYGSSSAYNDMNNEAGTYIARACNEMKQQIADKAIELARQDLEAAKQAAQAEALQVLDTVAN